MTTIAVLLTALLAAVPVWGQSALPSGGGYQPITVRQRVQWFEASTIGPHSLLGGTMGAAFSTALNRPPEYEETWAGFGKRYGMRMTGVATSNMMEASLGALWGEDPRYFRASPGSPLKGRVWNVVKMTFVAKNSLGENVPAFSRYLSIYGSNYLSNTWRPDGDSGSSDGATRAGMGFVGRMAGNAFHEFWPDAKRKVFRRK